MPPMIRLFLPLALLVAAPFAAHAQTRDEAAQLEFFEKKVRPVLAEQCFNCHSANTNSKGGLRVDDRNGLLQGGGRGAAVVPGHPEKSLLLGAVKHTAGKLRMPPEKQLAAHEIADLAQWIRDGAAWPKVKVPATLGKSHAEYAKLRKEHWAFQPLQQAKAPAVKDAAWARDDVDRFVLAALEAKKLAPVRDADKGTLIRRITFDLTGLPPTPEEIDAFAKDTSIDAFAKVVDRLLASPQFGERWGRHWLDIARYGESTGSARNLPYPHAWRYRDYVIDAINKDTPYNQFLREQIAGDLLPASSPQQRDEQNVATGFLALGVRDVNQRFKVRFVMDNVDEQIDTVTRSVLALTVSCARCHDHKFDPVPTTDYYALAGIFRSTDLCAGLRNKMGGGGLDYYDTSLLVPLGDGARPVDPKHADRVTQATKAYEAAKADFDAIFGTAKGKAVGADGKPAQMVARIKMNNLQKVLSDLSDPALSRDVTLGVRDAKIVTDTEIRIRGEAEKLGPVVPRGFLSLIDVPNVPKINPAQSGRLELAQWLTSDLNPLTSRVMANRVWQHLFADGLVASVDNFGVTGDAPSNAALLDHLAQRFVRDSWSVKKLVRALVLTRAYQLGSDTTPAQLTADPANRLVWRHSPRRLDAEEIRDATLSASGRIDLTRPKGSAAKDLKVIELTDNSPLAAKLREAADKSLRRSVYLPLVRGLTPRSLEVFDFAEQGMVTGSRDRTTVATQALYLLNDPFVRKQSVALADRVLQRSELDDAGRVQLAYRLTLGRAATAKEVERAKGYFKEYEAVARSLPPKSVVEPPPAKKKKDVIPANPDEVERGGETAAEETVQPADPRVAAWASFCQAILASAEFRYVR